VTAVSVDLSDRHKSVTKALNDSIVDILKKDEETMLMLAEIERHAPGRGQAEHISLALPIRSLCSRRADLALGIRIP
jgi:hypothetical protein